VAIDTVIRNSGPDDRAAIEALYRAAFPEEDLVPLVRRLMDDRENVVSLVATQDDGLAGHVALTRCEIEGSDAGAALLGPLAVAPSVQRRGVGGRLIEAGIDRLARTGAARVFVLGDPAYYARHDFRPDRTVDAPYPLPEDWAEAWQSRALSDPPTAVTGTLRVPAVWRDPALWGA